MNKSLFVYHKGHEANPDIHYCRPARGQHLPARPDTSSKVERCDRPLGTIAVTEAQSESAHALQSYGLGSPVALLRIMIQQSNCFQVVERGAAMANLQQERALAANGEMLGGSNVGKGQPQAADFVMTPNSPRRTRAASAARSRITADACWAAWAGSRAASRATSNSRKRRRAS